ncbi:MAG: hypothetical protein KAJ28_04555 [Flavobacteriaceae bacterium]|nr:hypothetical protein [Flavobacteriaceae bacterium]
MKKLFQFIIMIIMGLAINSCYYDAFPEEEIIDEPETPTEDVSYQNDIMPLWAQCVGCHSGNEPPDLRDANSYNALKNGFVVPGDADASTLYKSLLGVGGVSLMPPGSQWPNTKINLVKDWINQGALNN